VDEDGKGPDLVENADRQSRPRLDGSEAAADGFARDAAGQAIASSSADTAQDEPGQVAPTPTRVAIPPRPLRLAMMAASLASAAALGSFVGSLSAGGVSQFWAHVAPSSSSAAASDAQAPNAELSALSALKTYVEGAARSANNQFARLADRLDRLERAQAEPNAKLARIAEAVDRLEKERKRVMATAIAPAAAAPETTGTVPNSPWLQLKQTSCRIGSSTACAAGMRSSKIATATSSRLPATARFPALAGWRASSGRTVNGSS
jgi:hypothetical protein